MSNRDDFSEKVKRAVALRASWHCSFAGCAKLTVGPSEEAPDASTKVGEAAHICAASPGGRRYDPSMTPEERTGINNAIWLCSDHAKLIDRDDVTYTAERLRAMKRKHEEACARVVRAGPSADLVTGLMAFGSGTVRADSFASIGAVQDEIGLRITRDDIVADSEAAALDTVTVVGRSPRLDDLRKQRFRERPEIFSGLTADFRRWWDVLTQNPSDRLRIYWIDGRSGDGKSVLLLQLAYWILQHLQPSAAVLLNNPDDLPLWISLVADGQLEPAQPSNPALAFVDDLHAVGDLHTWAERLRAACRWSDPPHAAVIACGPTIDREIFERTIGNLAAVRSFNLPHLTESEFHEFRAWYLRRTKPDSSDTSDYHPNMLLVEAMFELVHNESLHEFSRRFSRRMSSYDLLETTKQILAINALQLPATPTILTTDKQRDLFRRLCDDDQLHFEELASSPLSPGGISFGHPQISLRIYEELLPAHATNFAAAWARDIAAYIGHCLSAGELHRAGTIIVKLAGIDWRRFFSGPQPPPTLRTGSADDALDEIYRKYRSLGHANRLALLPYWLDAIAAAPEVPLATDVLRFALASVRDPAAAAQLPRVVAGKLWLLAELDHFSVHADALRRAARLVVLDLPHTLGTRNGLAIILSRTGHRDLARELLRSYVASGCDGPDAYWLLNVAVANFPADPDVRDEALHWLQTHSGHQQTHVLLSTLVTRWYADEAIRDIALVWAQNNVTNPYVDNLLSCMLASWPKEPAIQQVAVAWLDGNPLSPRAHQLLTALIARSGEDDSVRERALAWLRANCDHPFLHLPLSTLVAHWPADTVIRDFATEWVQQQALKDSGSPAYHLLGTLVGRWPDHKDIRRLALDCLDRSPLPRDAYLLLAPLLSKSPRDTQVRQLVTKWLGIYQNDDHADQLLVPLIVNGPGDWATRDSVLAWLANNPDYTRGYWILGPLVAKWPHDLAVRNASLDWLKRNWRDRNADQLLAPLLHRWPADEAIRTLAIKWWRENNYLKPAPLLLAAIIRTSSGSEEWLRVGDEFVTSPHGRDAFQVVLAILDRSKADYAHIDITLKLIDRTVQKERRTYIQERFERILIHNLRGATDYLRGSNRKVDKHAVAAALSNAAKTYDKRVVPLLRQIALVPNEYKTLLLEGCCHGCHINAIRRQAILSWVTGSVDSEVARLARQKLQHPSAPLSY